MAKLTLSAIQGAYASTSELNANFDAIEAALENTLSRDGTTPNTMSADLDMNNQDLLNVENAYINNLVYVGESMIASQVSIADVAAQITATDVEGALAEHRVLVDGNVTKLTGYLSTGLLDVYASDLDSIVTNSKYSFIASGVTNEPADMVSTEYGLVETEARDANDSVQTVTGQTGTALGKIWARQNVSGTWTAWALIINPAVGASHPANAFFLMGA
jgi:hypothetical protein